MAILCGLLLFRSSQQAETSFGAGTGTKYGLHQDLTYDGYAWRRTQHVDVAKAVNAQVSRNSLLWHQIEQAKGTQDWSRTDAVVNELSANGIEPLFVVVGSPSWANGTPTSTTDYEFYVPAGTGATFTTWADNYAAFVSQAVNRYKGKVKKWELWNEQNQHYTWKPAPNLDQYAIFYTKVRNAILAADPTAQIASGGLSGLCCVGPGEINGYGFLQGMIDRSLPLDQVAIHPYEGDNGPPDVDKQYDNNFTDIGRMHDILVKNGRGGTPLWVTEWGWPSTAPLSEQTQANYLQKSLTMLRDNYPYVSLAIYFLDVDHGTTYYHGLYHDVSPPTPKPAANVFASFVKSLSATSSPTAAPSSSSTQNTAIQKKSGSSVAISNSPTAPASGSNTSEGSTTSSANPSLNQNTATPSNIKQASSEQSPLVRKLSRSSNLPFLLASVLILVSLLAVYFLWRRHYKLRG